ncbi:MAG: nucleotidyltransferase family protein [Rubrivivax sp.]|nr:nucleotidyltransferase family protein [Rubrivivax sp.]
MPERRDLVVQALTAAAPHFTGWDAGQWSLLLQQARAAGLLARVGQRLGSLYRGSEATPWPAPLQAHFESAWRLIRAQRAEVDRELAHIARALAPIGCPVVVLKGAAYHAADLPPAASRVFSDIDILVPRAAVAEAESQLMLHGWAGTHDNAYDQRYYRQWMHELPPMQHMRRGTTLDVHHNILPLTARLKPDGARLVSAARPLPGQPGLHVLAPPDMVLHAMTHLFMNDDMSHALRDLSDLDLLLRHFAARPGFWDSLVERASLLDLRRPLHYGLGQAALVLGTPVPAEVARAVQAFGPGWPLRAPMAALWHRAVRSRHPAAAPAGTGAALFALYLRGHWLRMPPLLLARHLAVKALRLRERDGGTESVTAPTEG